MRVTPSTSPAISSEKGSGTAMDLSRFSTPSSVLSPVLGGVTDTSTGRLGLRVAEQELRKVELHVLFLPSLSIGYPLSFAPLRV